MKKKVIITEEQLKFLVEDVRYTNNNGQINMSIGQSRDDKDNIGLNKTDTRVFGNRKNLLYGDGTTSKHVMNLNDLVLQRRANLVIYQNLIDYVKNGRKGPIFTDHNVAKTTVTAINKWLATLDDEEILRKATEAYNRTKFTNQQKDGLFDRIINSDNTDKIARYTSFTIPGTNVPCIALFAMDNFDLSDAIKKGSLRDTSVIWNSGKLGNPEDFNPVNGRIPVTYDNGVIPNIEQNFSLNGLDDINKTKNRDHFKNVQQYQDANNYTTINQFLDKSIMYASYALNKEGYRPDYIITVPSSSKMNYYYSTNLSNKMGIPYIPDFFQKNIINAHLKNGITDEYLQEQGMPPAKIMELKDSIKRYAYKEMVYEIEAPIRNVVNEYFELFSYISKTKNSREKATISDVIRIFSKHCFNVIKNEITNDNILGKYLVHNLLNQKSYLPEEKNILNSILFIVQYKIGKKYSLISLVKCSIYSNNIKTN